MKPIKKKVRIKRSLEQIQSDANRHTTRASFAKEHNASYRAAKKREDFEQIVAHMDPPKTKAYTLEEIQKEAKKYTKRKDFQKYSNGHYQAAVKRKDYEEIVKHMEEPHTDAYTLEEIQKEAKKHTTRSEFKKGNSSIYNAANKRDDFEEICAHMKMPINQAYTLEEIQEKADMCKSRGEFHKKFPSVYQVAHKREDYEKIVEHMKTASGSSNPEIDILTVIKNLWPKAQKIKDRKVSIDGKPHIGSFEVDIYIPELRKGIEFDGKWYHSFEGLKRGHPTWPDEDIRNYHEIKDNWFLSKGIQIFHIKEKEWIKDKDSCIAECLEFLSKPPILS